MNRREFSRHTTRALALGAMSGTLSVAAENSATERPPRLFRVWATSDAHVGTDFRPHPLSWASAFHANEPIVHLHRGKQPSSCAMLPAHFALPSTGLVWKSGTRARIEQTIPDGIVAC